MFIIRRLIIALLLMLIFASGQTQSLANPTTTGHMPTEVIEMTDSSPASTFTFSAPDGVSIFVRKWSPAGKPKAAVQIAHGAAEHSLRYQRFAQVLNQAGYVVYANDHRGHFMTAGSRDKAGIAGPDGWNHMLADAHQLTGIIRKENPGVPIFLLGHSMGSLLAQGYIERWGADLAGVILSGTFGVIPNLDFAIGLLEPLASGKTANEPCQPFAESFSSFNKQFEPAKTHFDWLSRDPVEVQKYVDDPWCGFPFSNSLVVDMFKGARDTWKAESEQKIPKNLPVYFVSGDKDPVGGDTVSVKALIDRYKALGIVDIKYKFYPDARHELLNETNRDEVDRDLLSWLDPLASGKHRAK